MQKTQDIWVQSLGQEDPLEQSMATHSSVLAWKIPWTEGLGRPQSMGCKELDTTEQLSTSGNNKTKQMTELRSNLTSEILIL